MTAFDPQLTTIKVSELHAEAAANRLARAADGSGQGRGSRARSAGPVATIAGRAWAVAMWAPSRAAGLIRADRATA